MKLFKNPIFMFILGGIIFTTVSVYANFKIQADEIEYSNGVSVKDKIDDLYTGIDNMGKTYKSNITKVNGQPNSIATIINLDTGKYICNSNYIQPFTTSTIRDKTQEFSPIIDGCNNYYIVEKNAHNKSGVVQDNGIYSAVLYGNINFTCDITTASNVTITLVSSNSYDENLAMLNLICNKIK